MSLIASISLAAAAAAEEGGHDPLVPFLVAGVAFAVFLLLGIVTWSYRDVANRTTRGRTASSHGAAPHGAAPHESHTAGH